MAVAAKTFAELYLGRSAAEMFRPTPPSVGYSINPDRAGRVVTPIDREKLEHAMAAGVAFADLGGLQRHVTETKAAPRDHAGRFTPAPAVDQGADDLEPDADPFEELRRRAAAAALGTLAPLPDTGTDADEDE